MLANIRKRWLTFGRKQADSLPAVQEPALPVSPRLGKTVEVDIAPDDPLLAHLLAAPGVVEIDRLELDSPALRALKDAGVKISVPLVSQGELIGVLNLGPRLSEQEYSSYDHRLLSNLATQAAPALRVAQLARQQQAEARERAQIEHELRVARVIQQTLLPKSVPSIPGWQLSAYWQPARAVSGDFYDFIEFPDGRLGVVVGDVTDKGVPAALVMATTRSIIRSAAERFVSPCEVLRVANDLICPDIPSNMFITCLFAVLDPATGVVRYANAGHNLPYQCSGGQVLELRATGMPLGLLPGMTYEEKEAVLHPGDSVILYSDGLVEAHNPDGEIFGFPRLRDKLGCSLTEVSTDASAVIDRLLVELAEFTGPGWEQEDDVTFVTIDRQDSVSPAASQASQSGEPAPNPGPAGESWQVLDEFSLPSAPNLERQAMQRVADDVAPLALPVALVERLKTAVAEATMNAMEHGNQYQHDLPVEISVFKSPAALKVVIKDMGGSKPIPDVPDPSLEAKLEGLQSPRGWGLFLIKNMVDEMNVYSDDTHHTIELIFRLEGVNP